MDISADGWLAYAAAIATLLFLFAYYKVKKTYRYFEDRNVPYVKPILWLGSDPKVAILKENLGVSWENIYHKLEGHKVGGAFRVIRPIWVIRDPEYVHSILISSFDYFVDRPFFLDENRNPLDAHLFLLRGNKWRFLRNKLSPIFSTGKLRYMFQGIDKCSDGFLQNMDEIATGKDVDTYEMLARYSTDIIGTCILGLEADALKNPDSVIRKFGKELIDVKTNTLFRRFLFFIDILVPDLIKVLKVPTSSKHIVDFFTTTIINVMDSRRKGGIERKDFIQLLVELKNKESLKNEDNETENSNHTISEKIDITDMLLVAQCFVFFFAGFETTSKTLNYTLYLLSNHQNVQDKLRNEILQVKAKHGCFDYDALKNMKYLDHCIKETLRIFPALPMLDRECTKNFTLPDGTRIEKGAELTIPIYAIQRDPKIFPDPLVYRPERFEQDPSRGTYAPFGDGPRICIGKRFAEVQMKVFLSRLLEKYKFDPSPLNTDIDQIKNVPWSFLLCPTNGLYVRINKL